MDYVLHAYDNLKSYIARGPEKTFDTRFNDAQNELLSHYRRDIEIAKELIYGVFSKDSGEMRFVKDHIEKTIYDMFGKKLTSGVDKDKLFNECRDEYIQERNLNIDAIISFTPKSFKEYKHELLHS